MSEATANTRLQGETPPHIAKSPHSITSSPATLSLSKHRPFHERQVVHYPDSDGKPMADNDPHYHTIVDTHFALQRRYADDPEVYISADLLIYYVEGDPYKSVAPDILVSFGVPKGNRRSYRIWEEGKPPDVIFEFASQGSWKDDLSWKKGLYSGLEVREYFLFDPADTYFTPLLQGYRLEEGHYEPLPPLTANEKGELGIYSNLLELELWAKPNGGEGMAYVLRLYDAEVDEWLPTPVELDKARRTAEARADREAQARQTAEAELARLQAELSRLRTE